MDTQLQRIIVISLALVALCVVVGSVILAVTVDPGDTRTLPDAVLVLGSVAVGALGGAMVPKAPAA